MTKFKKGIVVRSSQKFLFVALKMNEMAGMMKSLRMYL